MLGIPNFITKIFTFRYLSLPGYSHYLLIVSNFRPVHSQVCQFFTTNHSHPSYFIASRHITDHIFWLRSLLPTLPGFIHLDTVISWCMQEYQTICFKTTWRFSFQISNIQLSYFLLWKYPPISCLRIYKETFRTFILVRSSSSSP